VLRGLINVLEAASQEVLSASLERKGHDAYGAFSKDVNSTKTATKIKFN